MPFEVPSNPTAEHTAVLFIRAEVHEVQADGQLSGRPVFKVEPFVLAVEGADRAICIRKLNETLEELRKQCSNSTKGSL